MDEHRIGLKPITMLTAIAEDLAARQLAGLPVCLDEVLRADGADRADAHRTPRISPCSSPLGRTGRRQDTTEGFRP